MTSREQERMDDQDGRRDCVTCAVAAPLVWLRRHAFSLCPFRGVQQTSSAFLNLPEVYFTRESFGSHLILLTVEGPRCPEAGAAGARFRFHLGIWSGSSEESRDFPSSSNAPSGGQPPHSPRPLRGVKFSYFCLQGIKLGSDIRDLV